MSQPQFVPQIPTSNTGYGYRTPFGVTLPPGGQVAAFVRSTGPQSNDDPAIASNLMPTLAQGLARCRPSQGDSVIVLPGHAESVVDNTFLDNLVAGSRVIGCGRGALQPTFTWTAAAAQWRLNKTDCEFIGLKLNLGGFNGVTNAIAWTAADVTLMECDVSMGTSAALKAVVGITVSATPDRGKIAYCKFRGATAAAVTDGILISGTPEDFQMFENTMKFAGTTTNGLIRISGAATNIDFGRMRLTNNVAASTTTIAIADVASSGVIYETYSSILANGVAGATGILFAGVGTTTIKCFQCFTSDEPGRSGALSPIVVAT